MGRRRATLLQRGSMKLSETPLLSTTTQEILTAVGYLLLLTERADQFPPLDGTLPNRVTPSLSKKTMTFSYLMRSSSSISESFSCSKF